MIFTLAILPLEYCFVQISGKRYWYQYADRVRAHLRHVYCHKVDTRLKKREINTDVYVLYNMKITAK